jgi:hypothetical protein
MKSPKGDQKQMSQGITIIQTPHVNNINNYHSYNINSMNYNHGSSDTIVSSSGQVAPVIMVNPQLLMMGEDPALA